jgi:hypothetical protein
MQPGLYLSVPKLHKHQWKHLMEQQLETNLKSMFNKAISIIAYGDSMVCAG